MLHSCQHSEGLHEVSEAALSKKNKTYMVKREHKIQTSTCSVNKDSVKISHAVRVSLSHVFDSEMYFTGS